ncbi:MAG: hypothetical protein J6Y28_00430, partial [Acholeplasmatales bacterium]|nr:hypothetical protein [Acholeplasmatales bacterium]
NTFSKKMPFYVNFPNLTQKGYYTTPHYQKSTPNLQRFSQKGYTPTATLSRESKATAGLLMQQDLVNL